MKTAKQRQSRIPLGTRAVERFVPVGQSYACAHCGAWIKFRAGRHDRYIVCNVYEADEWGRLELFHPVCYEEAGQPHGEIRDNAKRKKD